MLWVMEKIFPLLMNTKLILNNTTLCRFTTDDIGTIIYGKSYKIKD